jgi:hypothetical protein
MSDAANRIVQKLWSYCNVLRDDGLSYQDSLERLARDKGSLDLFEVWVSPEELALVGSGSFPSRDAARACPGHGS